MLRILESKLYSHSFHQKTDGIMLIYDQSDADTFEGIVEEIVKLQKRYMGENVVIYLVAAKCDQTDFLTVSGKELLMTHSWTGEVDLGRLKLFETSARTGESVERVFEEMVDDIFSGNVNAGLSRTGFTGGSVRKEKLERKPSVWDALW